MIKLFRKTRQKLLMQNKTGQYLKYAIGEIILVVVGILIALYINNWNEGRKDRIKEDAILKELHKDFQKNLAQFNNIKKVFNNSLLASQKFREFINHPNPLSVQDSIAKYYFLGFNGATFNPSNGVVESLISSGEYQSVSYTHLTLPTTPYV